MIATDLGSTNGTTLDSEALLEQSELVGGATVRLGDTTIELAPDLASTQLGWDSPRPATVANLRQTSIDLVAVAVAEDRPDLRAIERDKGTLTIAFSDIESSTERAVAIGDEKWFELLGIHNSIVRRQVSRHGGTEIKSQGDGFMLTFPSARRGVQCMIEVQRALAAHGREHPDQQVSIRVGLHTGEVIVDDDGDLFGRHVNLAARIANQASGGEVLVSSLLREIIDARSDMKFGESRSVELKGMGGAHTVHPITID